MKTLNLIVLVNLIVSSCGQPSEPKAAPSPEPNPTKVQYSKEPKDIVVEYRKEGSTLVQVYQALSDLPKCEVSNDSKVAYVKAEGKFFKCEDARWLEVTLSDTEAVKEVKAKAPEPPVSPSPSPSPLSASQWLDPISGKMWVVGGIAPYRIAEQSCGKDYRLPNRDEAMAANTHGIKSAFTNVNIVTFWTSDLDLAASTTSVYVLHIGDKVSFDSALMLDTHQILCIKP